MNRRILILDTYYPAMLASDSAERVRLPYADHLAALLGDSFGTSDFVSRSLSAFDWTAVDVIANHRSLQEKWWREIRGTEPVPPPESVVMEQVRHFGPDVLFLQDISFLSVSALDELHRMGVVIAAQCSCAMPPMESLRRLDVIFTSFPHYVGEFLRVGIPSVHFLPLAFDPAILDRCGPTPAERDLDVVFVGGVGKGWPWMRRVETLEAVADALGPRFEWCGYGVGLVHPASALRSSYRGEAWGRDMYRLYRRAKIVIDPHLETAREWSNNLRVLEATGCGALLLTETSPNLPAIFPDGGVVSWDRNLPSEAAALCTRYLAQQRERKDLAETAQRTTLARHTYAHRAHVLSGALRQELDVRPR